MIPTFGTANDRRSGKRVRDYVLHYNEVRLHSAIDYVTPADKLNGEPPRIGNAVTDIGIVKTEAPEISGSKAQFETALPNLPAANFINHIPVNQRLQKSVTALQDRALLRSKPSAARSRSRKWKRCFGVAPFSSDFSTMR